MKKIYQLSDSEASIQLDMMATGNSPKSISRVILSAFGKNIVAYFVDKTEEQIVLQLNDMCNTHIIYRIERYTFQDRKGFNEPFIPKHYGQ